MRHMLRRCATHGGGGGGDRRAPTHLCGELPAQLAHQRAQLAHRAEEVAHLERLLERAERRRARLPRLAHAAALSEEVLHAVHLHAAVVRT